VNAVMVVSATIGVGNPALLLVVPNRAGVADRYPGVLGDGADHGGDGARMIVQWAPARRAVAMMSWH
jgi:hypothetical protein